MKDVDVLVTPTTATMAPVIPEAMLPQGESNLPVVDALMRFVRVANLTGFSSLSLPAGFDREGRGARHRGAHAAHPRDGPALKAVPSLTLSYRCGIDW